MVSEGDLGKPTKVAKDAQFPSKPRFDKVTGLAEPANKQDMAMDLPLRCYRCGEGDEAVQVVDPPREA